MQEASNQKLIKRINNLLEKYEISGDITYTIQEKDGIYQCVIRYQRGRKWDQFWTSTGYKVGRGNIRSAKKIADEIALIFKQTIKENKFNNKQQNITFFDYQNLAELNTTNYNPNKRTKADWDFYEYMEYWLNKIIINSVEADTFNGYRRQVEGNIKEYFTMKKHKKLVKEIIADDLDDFYDYLKDKNLSNASIDHYNDNISSAFKFLLKKKIVKYNPTKLINPIVVSTVEVNTYNASEIKALLDILKNDIIELATLFDAYYGLRRSEIFGLRKEVFDFDNNCFVINHVAIQNYGKKNKEKLYFRDKTKSKKGYRIMPLFPNIRQEVIKRFKEIDENIQFLGDTYNHKYDGYLFVYDNGDFIQPNYFTRRFEQIIEKNKLKKITPHGLRHSIATLLHISGVDIRDLQDWLGHQNISSTNRYTRSDYKKQVATGNVVSRIFK